MSEPTEEELRKLKLAETDALDKKPAQEVSDKEFDSRLRRARADQLDQANHFRNILFYASLVVLGIVVLTSVAVIGIYLWMQHGDLDPSVLIAWFGTVVVQIVGIVFVVAKYLFPEPPKPPTPPAATD